MNDNNDAFDLWWEWAQKPRDSMLTIDAEIHHAVMALPPDERRDRAKVNEAVREGIRLRLQRQDARRSSLVSQPKGSRLPRSAFCQLSVGKAEPTAPLIVHKRGQ